MTYRCDKCGIEVKGINAARKHAKQGYKTQREADMHGKLHSLSLVKSEGHGRTMERDTVYADREGGKTVYFTYSDGARIAVSKAWVVREERRGTIKIVDLTGRHSNDPNFASERAAIRHGYSGRGRTKDRTLRRKGIR